jgi:hypothetical protein
MAFLSSQERVMRTRRQAAPIDAISIELVQGLVDGMLAVLIKFVPRESEAAALDALFDLQAALLPGPVPL